MASKDNKVFATADILVDGEHVGSGEEIVADAATIKALLQSGRATTKAAEGARAARAAQSSGAPGDGE